MKRSWLKFWGLLNEERSLRAIGYITGVLGAVIVSLVAAGWTLFTYFNEEKPTISTEVEQQHQNDRLEKSVKLLVEVLEKNSVIPLEALPWHKVKKTEAMDILQIFPPDELSEADNGQDNNYTLRIDAANVIPEVVADSNIPVLFDWFSVNASENSDFFVCVAQDKYCPNEFDISIGQMPVEFLGNVQATKTRFLKVLARKLQAECDDLFGKESDFELRLALRFLDQKRVEIGAPRSPGYPFNSTYWFAFSCLPSLQ